MRRSRPSLAPLVFALVLWLGGSSGCQTVERGMQLIPSVGGAPTLEVPPTVLAQVGEGRLPVFGASLYSPGQEIYKELRQEESLMAFLACQGEPDHVEVVAHPNAPKIFLYYSRRGLSQTGTVEIYPSDRGFYAARPIDPKMRQAAPPSTTPPRSATPPPKPKPQPKPPPPPEPEPPTTPEPEPLPEAEPVPEPEPEPSPPWPEPTSQQKDDCPIEPWRRDCRDLCVFDAPWEWCDYEE